MLNVKLFIHPTIIVFCQSFSNVFKYSSILEFVDIKSRLHNNLHFFVLTKNAIHKSLSIKNAPFLDANVLFKNINDATKCTKQQSY